MTAIATVSLRGIPHPEFHYTVNIGGGSEVTIADQGKLALTVSTSAANTMRLAADGEKIYGRLETYEARAIEGIVVGTIALRGGMTFNINPDATESPDEIPAAGDFLVGAVADSGKKGYVRKATTAEYQAGKDNWLVVEVASDELTCVAIGV